MPLNYQVGNQTWNHVHEFSHEFKITKEYCEILADFLLMDPHLGINLKSILILLQINHNKTCKKPGFSAVNSLLIQRKKDHFPCL